jgi:hypothetical protein
MVKLDTVRESNAHFAREEHAGLVCVFAGATNGSEYAFLDATYDPYYFSSVNFFIFQSVPLPSRK